MKNKIKVMAILAMFLLSIISVVADLEIPELPEEDLNDKYFCDDVYYEVASRDLEVKPTCKARPTVKRGGGGFYIAKGKTMFNMESKYDGRSMGAVVLGKMNTKYKMVNFPRVKLEFNGKTGYRYSGVHVKEVKSTNPNIVTQYEFLENMDESMNMKATFRVSSKTPVKVMLDGKELKSTKVKKSKSQDEYTVMLTNGGMIDLVKVN